MAGAGDAGEKQVLRALNGHFDQKKAGGERGRYSGLESSGPKIVIQVGKVENDIQRPRPDLYDEDDESTNFIGSR